MRANLRDPRPKEEYDAWTTTTEKTVQEVAANFGDWWWKMEETKALREKLNLTKQ